MFSAATLGFTRKVGLPNRYMLKECAAKPAIKIARPHSGIFISKSGSNHRTAATSIASSIIQPKMACNVYQSGGLFSIASYWLKRPTQPLPPSHTEPITQNILLPTLGAEECFYHVSSTPCLYIPISSSKNNPNFNRL